MFSWEKQKSEEITFEGDLQLQEEGTGENNNNNNKDQVDKDEVTKPVVGRAIEDSQGRQQQQGLLSSWRAPEITMPNLFDTNSKRWGWGIFGLSVLIVSIALLASSLNRLESTEYGLEYNKRKKILDDAAKSGGLYAGPPGFTFIKFPSTFITEELVDTCLSLDGLRVDFYVSFQYQMPREWLVPTVKKYRNFEKWADLVEAAGGSAVQHTCAEFNINNFQNQRGTIQSRMLENLKLKLEGEDGSGSSGVYARAISLQLNNVEIPTNYTNAVSEKQSAEEDIRLAQNQRQQEITKAETALLAAQQEATRIMNTATNDAEIALTEARLEANETLYEFEAETQTIAYAKAQLQLTTAGVIAYKSNDLYRVAESLRVSAEEPASLSRKVELTLDGETAPEA